MKSYYTLIGIHPDGKSGEFEILFGDYNREVVEEEKMSEHDSEEFDALNIITTSPDQKDIDAKILELNTANPERN